MIANNRALSICLYNQMFQCPGSSSRMTEKEHFLHLITKYYVCHGAETKPNLNAFALIQVYQSCKLIFTVLY